MAILELETPYQKQQALLALFGLFIIIPTAVMSTFGSFLILGDQIMAMACGLSATLVVGGAIGYFTVIVDRAIHEVQIKVIQP